MCKNFHILILTTVLYVLYFPYVSYSQESKMVITLEEAYSLALKTHEHIMIAKKDVEKSRLLTKKALSVVTPRAYIRGEFVRESEEIKFGDYVARPLETWRGDFEITQPVYQGAVFPLRRQASRFVDSSTESYYQTIQETLFRVAQSYYQVLKAKELVKNAKEILNLAEEGLRVVRVRFRVGEVTKPAVLRGEVDVTKAQRNLVEAENNLQLAKDTLINLIGVKIRDYDVVKPPALPKLGENYEALINKAFKYRYDYKISNLKIDIAKESKDLVKARYHPSLDVVWTYHRLEPETFAFKDETWDAVFKVSVPLFEGGIRIWDLKEKQKDLRQAHLALEDLKKAIQIEVRDAMLKVDTYEKTLDNLKKQVELAQENYNIISKQFRVGLATSLDVTDALTALDSAKAELITKTYDYQVALLNLEKVIGLFAKDYIAKAPK
ncbi:MAG TPA: TolC family protein [Syntrophaceae bacterium]|nr:TolC family protein [Syntrophaceae bacterium]